LEVVDGKLIIDAPCCNSVRTCNATKIYIVEASEKPKILYVISAVRCNRGIRKRYSIKLDNIIVAHYYVSSRGNQYITILWKPGHVDDQRAEQMVRRVLGLEEMIEVDYS